MRFTPASFAIFTAMFTPEILAEQTGTSTIVLGEVNITQTAEDGEQNLFELYSTMRFAKEGGEWKIDRNVAGQR